MLDRRLVAPILCWQVGCGPAISAEDQAGSTLDAPASTSSVGSTSSLTTATSSATTSEPVPDTTSVSSSSSGSAPPPASCDCNFLCPPCPPEGCPDFDQFCNETFECDVLGQDCWQGEKCMPWDNSGGSRWNATRCVPVVPEPNQVGETCVVEGGVATGIDSCDVSQICFALDPDGCGTCVGFCGGTEQDPVCPDGQTCSLTNDSTLALCLQSCDPLVPTCALNEGCFPALAGTFACLPAPNDGIVSPFTCFLSGGCEPGTICLDPMTLPDCKNDGGCCTPYCDLTDPTCPPGTECVAFFEPGAVPEFEDVGVCALPL